MTTADPFHLGHIIPPAFALRQFGLKEIRFLTGNNPDKEGTTSGKLRHQMVVAGVRGNKRFKADRLELDRGPGKTYTIDTLRILRRQLGENTVFNLIVGLDNVAKIIDWHEGEEILRSCRLLIAPRGYVPTRQNVRGLLPKYADFAIIDSPLIDIASSQIRQLIGEDEHILAGYLMQNRVRKIVCIEHRLPKPVDRHYSAGSAEQHRFLDPHQVDDPKYL